MKTDNLNRQVLHGCSKITLEHRRFKDTGPSRGVFSKIQLCVCHCRFRQKFVITFLSCREWFESCQIHRHLELGSSLSRKEYAIVDPYRVRDQGLFKQNDFKQRKMRSRMLNMLLTKESWNTDRVDGVETSGAAMVDAMC